MAQEEVKLVGKEEQPRKFTQEEIEAAELMKLSRGDWNVFLARFKEIFLERLMEFGTSDKVNDHSAKLIGEEIEKFEKGEKMNYHLNHLEEQFAKLTQDARLPYEIVDRLKLEFFTGVFVKVSPDEYTEWLESKNKRSG